MTDAKRGLLVVDVQNDFCEGGSLAVDGGAAAAAAITRHLRARRGDYAVVVASRDWHAAGSDNGGHFAAEPDYAATWPAHCVAETRGAEYHPDLDTSLIDAHVRKGAGMPAYSMFEGRTDDGRGVTDLLREAGVTEVDVVGIATDYCVLQSALGALDEGFRVTVVPSLCAGVAKDTTEAALATLAEAGAEIVG